MACDICSHVTLRRSSGRRKWFRICKSCKDVTKVSRWFINMVPIAPPPQIFMMMNKLNKRIFSSKTSSNKLKQVVKRVIEKIKKDYKADEKHEITSSSLAIFRDNPYYDILVRPSDDGTPIPAHRTILANRSEILKIMLTCDNIMIGAEDTITLSDLNHDELRSLIDFLYSGALPQESMEKHARSLSIAADKFEIPSLQKFCEHWLIENLNLSNVLDTLEVSDVCSNQTLKEITIDFVMKNMQAILFTPRFDDFVCKNPHLTEEITREYDDRSAQSHLTYCL